MTIHVIPNLPFAGIFYFVRRLFYNFRVECFFGEKATQFSNDQQVKWKRKS